LDDINTPGEWDPDKDMVPELIGGTPLEFCAVSQSFGAVSALLEVGANPSCSTGSADDWLYNRQTTIPVLNWILCT